ncbi:MAG: HD domain-containing protein [Candidatus Omnitrophica bacterium]|nr:HD domain-containing protein [Candidatus Omnitrophota bacterium]
MKKIEEGQYAEELFNRLIRNEDLKKQTQVIGDCFKKPVWWFVRPLRKGRPDFKKTGLSGCGGGKRRCSSYIFRVLKKAQRTKKLQRFVCPNDLSGFCLPVAQGNKLYGYIGLCHLDTDMPKPPLQLFENFVSALVKDVQKDLELSKLYETIRPRAIALSTVHTIHRLISSTLDIDELLPRIARLSMQVVQAHRCSIKLLDRNRGILVPVITIDLRAKRKLHPKELRVGKGVPGRAIKMEKVLRGNNFLAVPLVDDEAVGVITIYDKINKKPFTQFDQEIMMTIAEQAVIAVKNAQLYKEQEDLAINSIKSLATVLDARGQVGFIPRSAFVKIVLAIGREIGMDQAGLRSIHYAALLHDAGQIFVPDEIMSKPTKLTGEEYQVVKSHPVQGAEILKPTKYLQPVIPIILHHHENYDGTGYPNQLKEEQIPLGARIMAVGSAFIAMITPRAYRVTKTVSEAIEEIKRYSAKRNMTMDLNRLLKDRIQFKIISFFHENPISIDTPRGIATWTGETKQNVKKALSQLAKHKVLTAHKVSSTTGYSYTRDPKLIKGIDSILRKLKKEEK